MTTLATMILVTAVAGAPAPAIVVLEDPAGDDVGPGSYVYPSDGDYRRGDFDLRRLEVVLKGDLVELRVTLGAPIRRYVETKRTNASDITLDNGIQVQNVDLYFDTDGRPGVGFTEAIPGRRVVFEPASAWDVAVVMTPQPFLARSAIAAGMSADAARHVLVPSGLAVEGNTIVAHIPSAALHGEPSGTWGYQVLVTGAIWQSSFDLLPRLTGDRVVNVFTMPVLGVAEMRAFGGGERASFEPWVVDLFAPPGRSQRDILSSWSERQQRYAVVPMIYPEGRPAVAAAPDADRGPGAASVPAAAVVAPSPEPVAGPHVLSVQDEWIVVSTSDAVVRQFGLGSVLDAAGLVVARIVVTKVDPGFVVAQVVEKTGPVVVGARVRFGSNKESETHHD